MIFDAAERHIREKGLDPEQITYTQVMDGIRRMQEKSDGLKEKYRALREELRDMEKQRDMIKEYLEKEQGMDRLLCQKDPGSAKSDDSERLFCDIIFPVVIINGGRLAL